MIHLPDRTLANGKQDLATANQPLIGPYDSLDPDVVEYQLASAWAAGINGFVVDWYGPNDEEGIDRAVHLLFQTIESWQNSYDISFALSLMYEEKILERIPVHLQEETAVSHFQYIFENYSSQTSYLTYEQEPVVFIFPTWAENIPGLLKPTQIERLKGMLPDFHLLYQGAEEPYLDVTDGFYTWVGGTNENPDDWGEDYANWLYPEQDTQFEKHNLDLTVGSVWAGFDDSGVHSWVTSGEANERFVDRHDGQVYADTWRLAIQDREEHKRMGPSWVQIVTWNDWNEGSEIEPCAENGRFYLEQTQLFTAEYSETPPFPPEALQIPELIYQLRKSQPGSDTESLVAQVYDLFFRKKFAEALALLEASEIIVDGDSS